MKQPQGIFITKFLTKQGIKMYDIPTEIIKEIEYIDHHLHGNSRVYGKSADQSGNDWALEFGLTAFRAISGNGNFGSDANDEAKVFGTDDTPFIAGQTLYDPGAITVTGVSSDFVYHLRFVYGTGTMADAIAAGQYSGLTVKFDSANPQQSAGIPLPLKIRKLPVGTKLWCQAKHSVDNAYIDFYMNECHGYE